MDRKKNTGNNWIVFTVLVTLVPVMFGILIFYIVNARLPEWSEILTDIMLVVFSIACSLISLCSDIRHQKGDKNTVRIFGFSGVVVLLSWTLYVVALTNKFGNSENIAIVIVDTILIIVCIYLGKALGKKYDENEEDLIRSMHDHCKLIQDKLFLQRYKNMMQDYMLRPDDLLCNPENFDRVQNAIDRKTGKNFEK